MCVCVYVLQTKKLSMSLFTMSDSNVLKTHLDAPARGSDISGIACLCFLLSSFFKLHKAVHMIHICISRFWWWGWSSVWTSAFKTYGNENDDENIRIKYVSLFFSPVCSCFHDSVVFSFVCCAVVIKRMEVQPWLYREYVKKTEGHKRKRKKPIDVSGEQLTN